MTEQKKKKCHLIRLIFNDVRNYDWKRFHPKRMRQDRLGWALRSLIKPISSYSDIISEGYGSLMLANILCVCMFLVACIEYAFQGFVFNYNSMDNFNLFTTLLSSSFLLILWTVANWGICSLLDGEGTFYDIWIVSCYAMLPRILFTVPLIFLTNAMTLAEENIYNTLSTVILLWCAVLLVLGTMIAHQYSLRKTLFSIVLSIAGIAIIFFIGMLLYSISQQFVMFIQTVIDELRYRV